MKIILLALLAFPSFAQAEWKLNPYTQRQDYYEGTAALKLSTGTFQAQIDALTISTTSQKQEIDALHVTTATLTSGLAAEISRATTRENDIGASTGTIYSALNSTASALTAEIADRSAADLLLIPSSATGTYPLSISGNAATASNAVGAAYLASANTFTSSNTITHPSGLFTPRVKFNGVEISSNSNASTGAGLQISSNVYIVGFSSATAYYGDGSHLTGVATTGGVVQSTAVIDGSPIGTFIKYGSTVPPAGYLYCNGTNYSTTTYSALFGVIGYKFGGSGANFTCDFRGMFARGVDDGRGLDPESTRVIGSTETDTLQGHYHTGRYSTQLLAYGPNANIWGIGTEIGTVGSQFGTFGADTQALYGTVRVSTETRPENVAVAVMVKYAHVGTVDISSTSLVTVSSNTYTGSNSFTATGTGVTGISSATITSAVIPTVTGNTSFTTTSATTTFAGCVDVGYVAISSVPSGNNVLTIAACPAGKIILGGGGYCGGGANPVYYSYPDLGANRWVVGCNTPLPGNASIAICARIKP